MARGFDTAWLVSRLAKENAAVQPADASDELESVIQSDIKTQLDSLGHACQYVWHRMDRKSTCQKGIADLVGCYLGVCFWIEVKRKGNKESPEQAGKRMLWKMAGAKTCVAYSATDVIRFMQDIRPAQTI